MKKITLIIALLSASNFFASNQQNYHLAYDFIQSMLIDKVPLNFKDAVFTTEVVYHEEDFNMEDLDNEIDVLIKLVKIISNSELIIYTNKDKDIISQHAGIFKVLTDSIIIPFDSTTVFIHTPYTYDFDDPFGQKNWNNMFVSKLLETGKGNCHSLPYLYKILSDELGIPCHLAFAPNHIYIKLFSEQTGWYNTELTSATFPVDAWIMASGYITTDAIRNGFYMDTLSTKQAVANCLVDLAHGYQYKFGRENPNFVIKCCNTTLEHHPANVNAMLTKAEAQKYYLQTLMKEYKTEKIEDLFADKTIEDMYTEMEWTYIQLYESGYRSMPEKMYRQWIDLLKKEPEKYTTDNIKNDTGYLQKELWLKLY